MPTKDEDLAIVSLLTAHPADILPYFNLTYFHDLFPTRGKVIEWIEDFLEKNGSFPKINIVKKHFPVVDTLLKAEPFPYCYDVLKQQYVDTVASKAGTEMTDSLDKKDLATFIKHTQNLADLISTATLPVSAATADVSEFIQELGASLDKDATKALKVMPTGLGPLDDADGGGLRPGHLYVIASLVNLGKTYVSLRIADGLTKSGFTVDYYSLEMTAEDIKKRALAVQYNLNVDEFINNEQPKASVDAGESKLDWYKKLLQDVQTKIDADKRKGKLYVRGCDEGFIQPRHVRSDIKQHNPDVIIVDAAQDLRDNKSSKERTPALYNALGEMNAIANTTGVAIVFTVQLDAEIEKKGLTKGNLTRIAWGQVFAQKAHIVITMLGDRASETRDMRIEKTRNGKPGRAFWLSFKFPCVSIEASTTAPGTLAELDQAVSGKDPAVSTLSELEQAFKQDVEEPAVSTPAPAIVRIPPTKISVPPPVPAEPDPTDGLSPYEAKRLAKTAKRLPRKHK